MTEFPVLALLRKSRAPVAVAADLVAGGKADIFLSPGNTGASLVVAIKKLGRLPRVLRSALAVYLSGEKKCFVLLDVGAGVDARPGYLAQFAVMGAAYAKCVLDVREPR